MNTYFIELNILRFIKLMKKMNDSDNEFGAHKALKIKYKKMRVWSQDGTFLT